MSWSSLAMAVEDAHHDIIDQEQRGGANQAPGHGVVVADDGILHGVGKRQQNHQVERIELRQLALARQPQGDNQKYINDQRAEEFFPEWEVPTRTCRTTFWRAWFAPFTASWNMRSTGSPVCRACGIEVNTAKIIMVSMQTISHHLRDSLDRFLTMRLLIAILLFESRSSHSVQSILIDSWRLAGAEFYWGCRGKLFRFRSGQRFPSASQPAVKYAKQKMEVR